MRTSPANLANNLPLAMAKGGPRFGASAESSTEQKTSASDAEQDTFSKKSDKKPVKTDHSKVPPTSITPDDIRYNPASEQQDAMEGQVINNVDAGWSDDQDRLIPAGIGGSEH